MATHGGGYRTRRPTLGLSPNVGPFEFKAPPELKGFRHFLGDPASTLKIDGGQAPQGDLTRLQTLMKRLSRCMTVDGDAVGNNDANSCGLYVSVAVRRP